MNYWDNTNPIYSEFAKQEGATGAQQLGWNDEACQARCFDVLMGLATDFSGPLTGKTVHDAGCGYGDLLARVRGAGAHYIGSDCMEASVQKARQLHESADFRHLNLLVQPVPEADVTVVCGALAFYPHDLVERMLQRFWVATRETLVFTSWWNVPPDWDNYKPTKQVQKSIDAFLRKNGSRRRKVFDYGNKYEIAIALSR